MLKKRGRKEAGFTPEGVCQALDYHQQVLARRPNLQAAPPWAIQMNAALTATITANNIELRRGIARALSSAHNAAGHTVIIPRGRPLDLDDNIPYPIPNHVFFHLTVAQIDILSAWCECPVIVGTREQKLRSLSELIGVLIAAP